MLDGLRAVGGGFLFIVGTPSVWPYAAVPAVLMVLLTCGLSGLGVWGANYLTEAIVGQPEGMWGQAGGWVLTVLLALAALLVAMLLALVLAQPLSGFALDAISIAQERALRGAAPAQASFFMALLASLRVALITIIIGGVLFTFLFVLDLLFPPVTIITVPLKFLVGGWLLAWNFLDYPLSLRGYGLRARLRWSWEHFEELTVFGLVWALLLPVPGLLLLVLPMGVAGATRLVVFSESAPYVVNRG